MLKNSLAFILKMWTDYLYHKICTLFPPWSIYPIASTLRSRSQVSLFPSPAELTELSPVQIPQLKLGRIFYIQTWCFTMASWLLFHNSAAIAVKHGQVTSLSVDDFNQDILCSIWEGKYVNLQDRTGKCSFVLCYIICINAAIEQFTDANDICSTH